MRSTTTRLGIACATLLVALFTRWAPAEAATPTLSVGDIEWFEEPRGISAPTVPLQLSAPTDHDVTVHLITVDGTAHGGYSRGPETDYAPVNFRATILAGETHPPNEINLFIDNDDVVEGDEHFFLRLSEPQGATIADGSGTVLVHNAPSDRDPPPAFVDPKDVLEGDTDTTASILVRLGAYSTTEQTVTLVTRELSGEATEGQDYEETVAVLRFPAGTLARRFDVPILGDQLDEDPEQFFVEVVDGFSTTSPDESAGSVTIYDDDSPSSK